MPHSFRRIASLALVLAVAGALAACTPKTAQPPAPFLPTASIRDLMEGLIDPAADALWDSVAYIANEAGVEDRRPRSEAQWNAVRTSAVNLIEAGNLLCIPGRRAAAVGTPAGPGELSPAEIERRIDGSRAVFDGLAHALQQTGLAALAAIDARNPQALMDAGSAIDQACEACHVVYWYPNQRRPGA